MQTRTPHDPVTRARQASGDRNLVGHCARDDGPERSKVAQLSPETSTEVHRLNLGIANVFLLSDSSNVLVDTGIPGSAPRIERWLFRLGLSQGDVSLIVVTHAHRDHLGGADGLRTRLDAPIAIAAGGIPAARRGLDRYGEPSGFFGRHVIGRFPKSFEPLEPDVLLYAGGRLDAYGVAATVVDTPGHTDHCVSIVTDDGNALVGDLFVGNHVFANRPGVPYLVESADRWRESRQRIESLPLQLLHPGHGKSFSATSLDRVRDLP